MKNGVVSMAFLLALAVVGRAETNRIMAQKVVEEVKAAHPEITGLELAAVKPGKGCQTIAATENGETGEACDQDEWTARKKDAPFVEEEKAEFDVTLPIHDSTGKIIATAGMDFKREAGRTKETVVHDARKIGAELERRLTSESELFRPAQ